MPVLGWQVLAPQPVLPGLLSFSRALSRKIPDASAVQYLAVTHMLLMWGAPSVDGRQASSRPVTPWKVALQACHPGKTLCSDTWQAAAVQACSAMGRPAQEPAVASPALHAAQGKQWHKK